MSKPVCYSMIVEYDFTFNAARAWVAYRAQDGSVLWRKSDLTGGAFCALETAHSVVEHGSLEEAEAVAFRLRQNV